MGRGDAKPRLFRCPGKDVPVSEALPLKGASEGAFPGSASEPPGHSRDLSGPGCGCPTAAAPLRLSPGRTAHPAPGTGRAAHACHARLPSLSSSGERKPVPATDRTPLTCELEGSRDPTTSVLRR